MDNKKHIVNLESFREMLHIFPRLPHQPFEEEILVFLCFLGHSAVIRKLTDVNINKLHQPWRSFAAIINKCLTRKSSSYDNLRLNTKKQRRGMRCIILGSRRDNHMFSTIKLVSRHQNTQQFGALLPIKLTNEDIRNSNAYKEYYAVATGATPPKPKSSIWKTRSSSDTTITPPSAAAGPRLTTSKKAKQATKASKAKSLSALSENSTDEEGNDGEEGDGDDDDDGDDASDEEESIHPSLNTHAEEEPRDEESFDPISKTPKDTDDEGNGEENLGLNVGREEGHDEKEEEDELYRDQSSSVSSQFVTSMLNLTLDAGMESIFETTSQMDVQTPTSVAHLPMSAPTLTSSTITTITTTQQAPTLPTTSLSTLLQDLPNFGSLFGFVHRLKTLEANFSEFMQTNQFAGAVFAIPWIVQCLDTYGDTVTLKRCRDDDADRDEEPSTGGPRDAKKERSLSQQALQRRQLPGALAGQLKGLDPDRRHQASLLYIVIQRRVEDLQLGVESYQKNLNLTKPDTYRSDLKRKEAYIAYFNPRGLIYQNKDKKNMLMRIDELHKFSDGTLTDVRTALDDRLKGIWMQYLPQTIWRKSNKDRVAAMIQAIDKRVKTRRIMRSLERFVGGRLYEGDFRMLQRTI
nr:hypothetical protein [Tanacetum cinerariifolium]